MRLSRPERKPSPIGLTPLIDVVFLLLIFFMLASTFLEFAGTSISGASRGGAATSVNELALIQVRAGREIGLNGRKVAIVDLAREIETLAGRGITRGVVRPAPEASVQDLVDVLAIARRTSLKSVVVVR